VPILILAFLVYKVGEKISREVWLKLLEFALKNHYLSFL
jgi:hypothetical protein